MNAAVKTNGNRVLMALGAVDKHLYNKIQPMYTKALNIGQNIVEQASGGKIPAASLTKFNRFSCSSCCRSFKWKESSSYGSTEKNNGYGKRLCSRKNKFEITR